jgi:hypothetical protein
MLCHSRTQGLRGRHKTIRKGIWKRSIGQFEVALEGKLRLWQGPTISPPPVGSMLCRPTGTSPCTGMPAAAASGSGAPKSLELRANARVV